MLADSRPSGKVTFVGVVEPKDLRAKRQRLGAELRILRETAGVSGRELGRRIGISQSKVSRIESGSSLPPVRAVAAWADAVGAAGEKRDQLAEMTAAVFSQVQEWRSSLALRGHLQDDIWDVETRATCVRVFQPSLVPGLLQTAEYARRVFTLFHVPYADDDLARAVAARMNRQTSLYEEERSFSFLVTEAALRWRPGPTRLLSAQLDRISSLSTLKNVSIGLLPTEREATTSLPPGFDIYEGQDGQSFVTIETVHAGLVVGDPEHVAAYERKWTLLSDMAVFDDAARTLIESVRSSVRQQG